MINRVRPDSDGQPPAAAVRLLGWATIAVTALITLPRLTPIGNGDFFTFVSVAERLRSGDRLYTDVWDNKDPYFYYALSLAGSLGPWGYFLLELTWVGAAVLALAALGRSQGMSRDWSLVVAGGMAPWCLVGYAYTGTMSMMPGVALVLVALALASGRRWVWVGVVLGLLAFLKLILVPVAVVGATVFWGPGRVRPFLAVLGGGAASTAMGVLVLGLRGELPAYVSMLRRNSEYAGRMVDGSGPTGFVQHLARAFPGIDYPGERIAASAIALVVVLALLRWRPESRRLVLCAAVVALACVLVLGLTAVWSHHALMLGLPACLIILAWAQGGPPRGVGRNLVLLPVGVLAAYVMGGAAPLPSLLIKPPTAAQPLDQVRGDSPEAVSISDDDVASYSRLGRNDNFAHARGLDELELACRDFQQYPFDPPTTFSRTLKCLPGSDVVFVADNFADQAGPADYLVFAADAEAILGNDFDCTATDYGRKCLRTGRTSQ